MLEKKRKNVLAIDDDLAVCRLLEIELEKEGLSISSCNDGLEGLGRVKKELPDLVILDLDLPGLSGEAVCKELKKDPLTENIPIIMLTGKDTDVDRVIGKVIGATYYVSKPFDRIDLLEKVRACIS